MQKAILILILQNKDLNMYLGEDTYDVKITNFTGDIIYNKIFEDDGDKTSDGKLGKEQNFNIYLDNLKSDIYYINFISDKNNDAADSTIKNININSNKILIVGTFLPITPFEFYTKADLNKTIGFYYWHYGKDQIIDLNNKTSINLNTDWSSKRYNENLTKGEYAITTPKGDLWIYNDISSPSKSSWFDIPVVQQNNFDNPNLIIIDQSNFNENTGAFSYSQDVNTTIIPLKISLRALTSNSANFKDAKLILK